jgi:UDP-glucuronate 4-epimerase
MTYLVTGAAGFIGFHVARDLLDQGEEVVGVDNLNAYYSPKLKRDRLAELEKHNGFRFHQADIADSKAFLDSVKPYRIPKVIHLAAQAGVRYSIEHPETYIASNLIGHFNILEYCRHSDAFEHLVYASSSSVYGGNAKVPFSESDRVDQPVSLYAATKRCDELMSHTYSHLYRLPQTGLRFFTVYGPWGRPDMAMWLFTEAILAGRPIKVFNHGEMRRDFTYIDDVAPTVIAAASKPPCDGDGEAPQRLYNLGGSRSEHLMEMIGILENALGRKAVLDMQPMQPGDVPVTSADITKIEADLGFSPKTRIEDGIPKFVAWYRAYHGL